LIQVFLSLEFLLGFLLLITLQLLRFYLRSLPTKSPMPSLVVLGIGLLSDGLPGNGTPLFSCHRSAFRRDLLFVGRVLLYAFCPICQGVFR
jgi:hypothetical protein